MSLVTTTTTPGLSALTLPSELKQSALALLQRYWGYDGFLPLQEEAVASILNRKDSLVILPTGSGKSLCYQLPVLMMQGIAVVLSPLLSLMKDQVDTLNGMGIPAGMLHGGLTGEERRALLQKVRDGELRLLYAAPEALANEFTLDWLRQSPVAYFVIDEAHCISQWGHDFRSAYREMGRLRGLFPDLGIHAFTATATPPVRQDIAQQLHLRDVEMVVGYFDRPNLLYRVLARDNPLRQIAAVVDRYPDEGGIVYCISRRDVEETADALKARGYKVVPYHAGLPADTRQRNQDAFMNERVNIVVATVAFGMGIDRSNIRYVIHTGLPKAIENYQQEAGRAGRDRQDAECVLLYSGGDVAKWRTIMGEPETDYDKLALSKLYEMSDYCQQSVCRHRFLVEYFGQAFQHNGPCSRCDFCLGEHETVQDGVTLSRKILSCIVRTRERFGAAHVAAVLAGADKEKIRQFGHDRLSTYGIMADFTQKDIQLWIDQLAYQDFLLRDPEYGSLRLTASGVQLLRDGEGNGLSVTLARPVKPRKLPKEKPLRQHGPGPERPNTIEEAALLEELRRLRRKLSMEKRVPAYIIFSDVTLQHLAQQKPRTLDEFRGIQGVGDVKLNTLGPAFLECIEAFLSGAVD